MGEIYEDFGDMIFNAEYNEKSVKKNNYEEIEDDFGEMKFESEATSKEQTKKEIQETVDENFENMDISQAENDYRLAKQVEDAKPIIKSAVKEATEIQKKQFKLEVSEVLQDEVSYRLDKYDKKRRWRYIKEKISFYFKLVIVIVLLLIVFGNSKIRSRVVTITKDFYNLVIGVVEGDDVSSNQLVDDITGNDDNNVK